MSEIVKNIYEILNPNDEKEDVEGNIFLLIKISRRTKKMF